MSGRREPRGSQYLLRRSQICFSCGNLGWKGGQFPHLQCSGQGCVAALPSPGPCSPAVRGGSRRPGAPPGPGPCPCRRAVRSSVQSLPVTRWGSVPCALLLSLQLTDFNKENTAVCFLCALKLETCLVPTVPLEEVSIDVPGAGAAPSFARRVSAPCFPACRRGTLHQGMEGWPGGPRCPELAAV